MRNFVTIIIVATAVGLVTAQHQRSVSAASTKVNGAIDKISALAVRSLQPVLPPPPPPPPVPPVNLLGTKFVKPLTADSALVVDHTTDVVLYEKRADDPHAMASVTKLMTALLLTERISDWDATTTISAADIAEGNQMLGAGEVYSLKDLFTAALVGSINTAVNALVAANSVSAEEFVASMNLRARELGLSATHFDDPTGLSPKNISTAHDIARLLKISLSHPRIKVTSVSGGEAIIEHKSGLVKKIKPTDWLVNNIVAFKGAHVEGGKTGYIPEAGYNFAVQVKNDAGHELRIVVLGTKDVYARFTEAAELADWTYKNFQWLER